MTAVLLIKKKLSGDGKPSMLYQMDFGLNLSI